MKHLDTIKRVLEIWLATEQDTNKDITEALDWVKEQLEEGKK